MSDYHLSRVRRVAKGCGRPESDVKDLLVKFATMRQLMMAMGAQQGLLGKIPGFKNIAKMKQLAGMDMSQLMKGMARFQSAADGGGQPMPSEGGRRQFGRSKSREKAKRKRKQARKDRKRSRKKRKK